MLTFNVIALKIEEKLSYNASYKARDFYYHGLGEGNKKVIAFLLQPFPLVTCLPPQRHAVAGGQLEPLGL